MASQIISNFSFLSAIRWPQIRIRWFNQCPLRVGTMQLLYWMAKFTLSAEKTSHWSLWIPLNVMTPWLDSGQRSRRSFGRVLVFVYLKYKESYTQWALALSSRSTIHGKTNGLRYVFATLMSAVVLGDRFNSSYVDSSHSNHMGMQNSPLQIISHRPALSRNEGCLSHLTHSHSTFISHCVPGWFIGQFWEHQTDHCVGKWHLCSVELGSTPKNGNRIPMQFETGELIRGYKPRFVRQLSIIRIALIIIYFFANSFVYVDINSFCWF